MTILTGIVCGFLWAFGGAHGTSKNWRRFGVGIIISIISLIYTLISNGNGHSWAFQPLIALFMWGATATGYGQPDASDEGSPLGRFWFHQIKKPNETRFHMSITTRFNANLFTRLTVAVLYALALLPTILIGNWIFGAIYIAVFIPYITAIWKPQIMIRGLSLEEFMVGFTVGFGAIVCLL